MSGGFWRNLTCFDLSRNSPKFIELIGAILIAAGFMILGTGWQRRIHLQHQLKKQILKIVESFIQGYSICVRILNRSVFIFYASSSSSFIYLFIFVCIAELQCKLSDLTDFWQMLTLNFIKDSYIISIYVYKSFNNNKNIVSLFIYMVLPDSNVNKVFRILCNS